MEIFRIVNQFIMKINQIRILRLATLVSRNHNSISVVKEKLKGVLIPIYNKGRLHSNKNRNTQSRKCTSLGTQNHKEIMLKGDLMIIIEFYVA